MHCICCQVVGINILRQHRLRQSTILGCPIQWIATRLSPLVMTGLDSELVSILGIRYIGLLWLHAASQRQDRNSGGAVSTALSTDFKSKSPK